MNRASRRAMPPHLIEASWEVFKQHHYVGNGIEEGPNDKLYFLSGVAAAIGVLVGTIDVGIPNGTRTFDVMSQIINDELPRYSNELAHLVERAKNGSN